MIEALTHAGVDAFLLTSLESLWCESHTRTLIDMYGDFRTIYGMTGRFICLIRPDDHVGLFQRPINQPALRDYLRELSQSAPEMQN